MSEQEALSTPSDVRTAVREHYAQAARAEAKAKSSCCSSGATIPSTKLKPFTRQKMPLPCRRKLPASPWAAAIQSPGFAKAGETVLDLGSGGGIDCFLAGKRVGPSGRVIGVDMTAEMLERARANKIKVGADNVEFRLAKSNTYRWQITRWMSLSRTASSTSAGQAPGLSGGFRALKLADAWLSVHCPMDRCRTRSRITSAPGPAALPGVGREDYLGRSRPRVS